MCLQCPSSSHSSVAIKLPRVSLILSCTSVRSGYVCHSCRSHDISSKQACPGDSPVPACLRPELSWFSTMTRRSREPIDNCPSVRVGFYYTILLTFYCTALQNRWEEGGLFDFALPRLSLCPLQNCTPNCSAASDVVITRLCLDMKPSSSGSQRSRERGAFGRILWHRHHWLTIPRRPAIDWCWIRL